MSLRALYSFSVSVLVLCVCVHVSLTIDSNLWGLNEHVCVFELILCIVRC